MASEVISSDLSPSQRTAIHEELNRIVEDPSFKNSKRCVALLRCIVDYALEGHHDGIKERTLGVEVFGRDPGYDTGTDSVVRMTANEIRKRLAQYYQDSNYPHTVRIRLISGSYIPEFDFDRLDRNSEHKDLHTQPLHSAPQVLQPVEIERVAAPSVAETSSTNTHKRLIVAGIILAALLAGAGWLAQSDLLRSSQYLVWKPLLDSNAPLILCVGDNSLVNRETQMMNWMQVVADAINSRKAPAVPDLANYTQSTMFDSVESAHRVSIWLTQYHSSVTLRPASALTLQDFRSAPAILVGSFDNQWSLILLSHNVRFSERVDPATHMAWIQDARDPSKRNWNLIYEDNKLPSVDYALITRLWDAETGNWILMVGGLSEFGTVAASQLITDPSVAKLLPADVRSARNFQIVIKADLINGIAGPPQVLAFHSW